jgi:hypothetical protein
LELSNKNSSLPRTPHPPHTTLTTRETLLNQLSLLSHLNSLTATLQTPRFSQDLKSTAVYPQTNFPVRSHKTILTSLLRRKLLPDDEQWELTGRLTSDGIYIDPEHEDEFIEWAQMKFLEIVDGREYRRGTKTKEQCSEEADGSESESEEDEENGKQGIRLGASLKYLAQGWEPSKPTQSGGLGRPIER